MFWRQIGGHLKRVETCSVGITWGVGYDNTAWVYTDGWGGVFLKGIEYRSRYIYMICTESRKEEKRIVTIVARFWAREYFNRINIFLISNKSLMRNINSIGLGTSNTGINTMIDIHNYYVYENQRWNPVTGYTAHGLPTDRYMWSDATGRHKCTREHTKLLSMHWHWVSECEKKILVSKMSRN